MDPGTKSFLLFLLCLMFIFSLSIGIETWQKNWKVKELTQHIEWHHKHPEIKDCPWIAISK